MNSACCCWHASHAHECAGAHMDAHGICMARALGICTWVPGRLVLGAQRLCRKGGGDKVPMRSRDRAEIEPRPPRRSATAVHDATPPPCPRRAMFEADWTLVRRARKGFIPSLIASCDASLRAQRGLADSPRGADDRSSRPPKRAGGGQLPNTAGGELPPEGLEEIEVRSPEAPSRRRGAAAKSGRRRGAACCQKGQAPSRRHGACMRAGTRGLARRRPQRPAWPLALVPVGDTPGAGTGAPLAHTASPASSRARVLRR